MITIAIPFYNAEPFLADAIRSVFAQTYKDWELILIDDGSTDNSLKIAQSIKDSRVRVISDGKNKKLATRLNEVTNLAKYDYIARMDADDLMSPTRIEKQMDIFKMNPTLDLVTCGNYSLSNSDEIIGGRWPHSNDISHSDLLKKKGSGILHAAILAKKSWYQRNKYNSSLATAQDYELWVRSSANKDLKIFLIQEPLYYYREEGNIAINKLLRAYEVERIIYRKYALNDKIPLVVKSYLKTIIVSVLNKLKKTDLLLKGRNTPLNSSFSNVVKEEFEIIRNTKIPGIDYE